MNREQKYLLYSGLFIAIAIFIFSLTWMIKHRNADNVKGLAAMDQYPQVISRQEYEKLSDAEKINLQREFQKAVEKRNKGLIKILKGMPTKSILSALNGLYNKGLSDMMQARSPNSLTFAIFMFMSSTRRLIDKDAYIETMLDKSTNRYLRHDLADSFGILDLPLERQKEVLFKLCQNPQEDSLVKLGAVKYMSALNYKPKTPLLTGVTPDLIKIYNNIAGKNPEAKELKIQTIRTAGFAQDKEATEWLMALYTLENDSEIRDIILFALNRIGDPRAGKLLLREAQPNKGADQAWAIKQLDNPKQKTIETVKFLEDHLLNGKDPSVRDPAASALISLNELDRIKEVVRKGEDGYVFCAIFNGLMKLNSPEGNQIIKDFIESNQKDRFHYLAEFDNNNWKNILIEHLRKNDPAKPQVQNRPEQDWAILQLGGGSP